MAKFKKKKSKPTEDNDDLRNKTEPKEENTESIEDTQTPETEKVEDLPVEKNQDVKKEKQVEEIQTPETKKKLDKLFWLRVGLAVIAGTTATFIFDSVEGEERRWASIAFMIIIFIVSAIIAKGMGLRLPSSDRKKIVTQGLGSYIFIYLFMWIVTYTLVNASETGSTFPSPLP